MSAIKHALKRSVTRMQDQGNRSREERPDRDDELWFELIKGLVWAHRQPSELKN